MIEDDEREIRWRQRQYEIDQQRSVDRRAALRDRIRNKLVSEIGSDAQRMCDDRIFALSQLIHSDPRWRHAALVALSALDPPIQGDVATAALRIIATENDEPTRNVAIAIVGSYFRSTDDPVASEMLRTLLNSAGLPESTRDAAQYAILSIDSTVKSWDLARYRGHDGLADSVERLHKKLFGE